MLLFPLPTSKMPIKYQIIILAMYTTWKQTNPDSYDGMLVIPNEKDMTKMA